MAITVKHTKVSTIPDGDDSSVVRPSDWNADHQLTGTIPVENGGTGASTLTGYVKGNGTSTMTASATVPNTDVTGLGTMSTQNSNNISVTGGSMSGVAISDYVATAQKGVANGVATLDSGGKVPISELPAAVIGALSYQGTWNASTNTPTLVSSVGTKGYYYVVSVAGSTNLDGITDWKVGDWAVYNGTAWQKVDNTDAVTSVNGYTGTVVLTAADVSAVPYTGATTAVDLNAKSLTNVSNLGVGTTVVPTIKIRAVGDNNSSSRIAMRGYSSDANSSAIRVTKFRGTAGAPQAPQSGDSLGKFELAGYGTTSSEGYPQASLEGLATEAWGATARGTKAVIKVTPNTTTTQVTAVTINQDSTAVFANTVTANGVLLTGNTGTVTSVAATAGTGIAITGSPITTSGTLNITNTAPDQTVALSSGTGISVTGTYPNFTVTNTAPSSGGTVTSVTGTAPVVSSGGNTPAISMAAATGSVDGYLTSTDWTTFNNKGSGTVTSVATGTGLSGGPITGTGTISLANTAVTPAAYTNANITVDAQGRITSASNGTGGSGTVTSVAATVPSVLSISGSPITTSGTLAIGYSGTALPVANGGSGETSYTNGQLLIGNTTGNTLTKATLTAGTGISVTNGTGSITIANNAIYTASYLVVAGGGGGATNTAGGGSGGVAGGGAGGFQTGTTPLLVGQTYTITVGGGGNGGTTSGAAGANGSNSVFSTITSIGGGGGASGSTNTGASGGSGGGSYGFPLDTYNGGAGTTGQGNAGGRGYTDSVTYTTGGGGGGAGAAAVQKTSNSGGDGGAGSASSITGSSVTYAGGGGGGASGGTGGAGGTGGGGAGSAIGSNATNGTANTGGGGGGVGGGNAAVLVGGNGGSGVVILSVPTANYSSTTTGSPTVTTSGSNTIMTFTASGSYTA